MLLTFKEGALEKIAEANAKSRASYDWIAKYADIYDEKDNRVLDVGIHGDVWPGGHKFLFKKATYETLDIDPKVAPTFVADIRDMPFEDETWDMIICHSVIEHVLQRRTEAYDELFRVLKRGGILLYNIPIYMDKESEPASVVSRTQLEEAYKTKDFKLRILPDRCYFVEVRK
jgi:SAM-dependent methyltransferase